LQEAVVLGNACLRVSDCTTRGVLEGFRATDRVPEQVEEEYLSWLAIFLVHLKALHLQPPAIMGHSKAKDQTQVILQQNYAYTVARSL
jgi:hypothetical protein